jgi:membrane-bound metal-dependent hydrolase YbcI (DUF457 family)
MISWLICKKLELDENTCRAFLLASLIPDIDVGTLIFGFSFFLKNHATISHSIIFAILFALTISLLFRDIKIVCPALAGIFLHLSLDILLNTGIIFQGGCTLLWPFSRKKFLLVYYIDVPMVAIRFAYAMTALTMYSSALYFMLKKDYPWSIWIKN